MKSIVSWKKKYFSVVMIVFLALFIVACGDNNGDWNFPPEPPTGTAPTITNANSTVFTEGTAGTFTFTATGDPTPTFALAETLPPGLTFDATTGVLSGTPEAGTNGTYPLTITASNGLSPDATQAFTLTVDKFINPDNYVYVNNDAATNYVSAFAINVDGTLEELADSPYATGGAGAEAEPWGYLAGNGIALAPVKRLLFASNIDDSTITVFSVNRDNGTLTKLGDPVSSGGTMGRGGSVVVSNNENYLFVANDTTKNISVFAVSMSGELTPVTGSPFSIGLGIDGMNLNLSGNIMYLGNTLFPGQLGVLNVANNGSLSPITGSPFSIGGDGYMITSFVLSSSTIEIACAANGIVGSVGALYSYSIDATGAPTLANSLVVSGNGQAVTTARNGSLAIRSDGLDRRINVVNVAADGTLTEVAGSPFNAAAITRGYAVTNQKGTFLYATESTQIEGFSIGVDGALTTLGTFPLTNPGHARRLVIY